MPKYTIDDGTDYGLSYSEKKGTSTYEDKKKEKKIKKPKIRKEKGVDEPLIPVEDSYISSYNREKRRKKIAIMVILIIIVFVAMFVYKQFKVTHNKMQENISLKENEVLMPNVAGYDIEAALELLSYCELNGEIIYSHDPYCAYDTIIKTDISKNSVIEKGSTVQLYVCQQASEIPENVKVTAEETPYVKDYIEIDSMEIEGETFVITIKNVSNYDVASIAYTLLYRAPDGTRIGERTYIKDNVDFKPNGTLKIRNKVKAPDNCSLSVSRFSCSGTPVKAKEE